MSINQIDYNRKYIDIQINSQPVKLQIDSAADISIISRNLCNKLDLQYSTTTLTPNCASGTTIKLMGEIECDITFKNETRHTVLYVSDINNLNIFGIDLLDKFDLWKKAIEDFCTVYNVQQHNDYPSFLKSNFYMCFEETLGKCTKSTATLTLKEDAKPPFCKSRPVPFAVQPLIEKEINRLQTIGIISPVTTANIAAPIVVKQKKNRSFAHLWRFLNRIKQRIVRSSLPVTITRRHICETEWFSIDESHRLIRRISTNRGRRKI